jgi:hypothetical protein
MIRWLVALCLALPAFAQDVKTYIPVNAGPLLPVLGGQIREVWPTMPVPHYFAGLIEQESCIGLKHSKCWSATSRLKSDREEGAGLGQITRAYKADGSVRFDALEDAKRLDAKGLNDLRWETVYSRPDLQMRVIVLMTRANWNRLDKLVPDVDGKLAMTDAAYNGGLGGVINERRACGLRDDCNPNKWFGNVEKVCLKSKKPLYGNRNACDINREHVDYVLNLRMNKYKGKV